MVPCTQVQKVSCLVKYGGLFFLGIPFNSDTVVFNVHRLYGPVRMPMLTAGWQVCVPFRSTNFRGSCRCFGPPAHGHSRLAIFTIRCFEQSFKVSITVFFARLLMLTAGWQVRPF